MKDKLGTFRLVGFLEGSSFLILLLVAMPMKYVWGEPMGVRIVGMVHGLLFIAYVGFIAVVGAEHNWSGKKKLQAFIAAIVPLGTFYFDKTLKQEAKAGRPS